MKKALTLFLAALMLCSCATVTVSGSSTTDSENFAIVPVSDMDIDTGWSGTATLDTTDPYQGTASRSVTFTQISKAGGIKFQFDHPTQTYDISAMKYLYFDLYLSDANVFADEIFDLELRSPNGDDYNESCINQRLSAFLLDEPKSGWNHARVDLSSMKSVGTYSAKKWVYLRFFNAADETIGIEGTSSVIKMDNVYFASAERDATGTTQPSVSIKNAVLELSDSFGITFDVEAKSCVPVMEIEPGLYEQGTLDEKTGRYSYDYTSIHAHLLADTIYPTFVYIDGDGKLSKYTYSDGYSVKQYCKNMLDKIDKNDQSVAIYTETQKQALKRLLSDALHYGAAAQQYASYHVADGGLASDGVTHLLSSQAYVAPTDYVTMPLCGAQSSGKATWHGVSLVLDSAMRIRYFFTATSVSGVKVDVVCDNVFSKEITSFSSTTDANGQTLYYFDVPVYADCYDEVVTASFVGCPQSRVAYSVNTYIKNNYKDDDSALSTLLGAINSYGNAAKAYVATLDKNEGTMTYYQFTTADQTLYDNSYSAFVERVAENGYAPTSVTGAYGGEFVRDASCQLLAHIANGDHEAAQRMLQYIYAYHKADGIPYARHIIDKLQTVATYDYLDDSSSASRSTYYQAKHETELFGIKKDTNACAQKFSVPSDKITGISVYLKNIPSDGQLVLELSNAAPANGQTISFAQTLASVTLSCADISTKDGWTTFRFDSPVSVTANQDYYFSVHIENTESKAKAFGIEFSPGLGSAFNFDTSLGGWYGQHNKVSLAFTVMMPEKQSISETQLFNIKEGTNACAQQFSVSDDKISGISVYLKNIPSDGKLILEVSETAPTQGSKTIPFASSLASVTLNCADVKVKSGWTTFKFDTPVNVTANRSYYFSVRLESSSGTANAFGLISAPGTAFNYDLNYCGGWDRQHSNSHLAYEIFTTQYELLFKDEQMPVMGIHTINQGDLMDRGGGGSSFVATSEYVSAIDVYLKDATNATKGTVTLWLGDVVPSGNDRNNPFSSGHELAKVEVNLSNIVNDWVNFKLATPVSTTVGQTYYFVVSASSDTDVTILTVGRTGVGTDGHALTFNQNWNTHAGNSIAHRIYGAAPDLYSSYVMIGGDAVAVQTVDSSLNSVYVTCAELRLARAVDAADGDTYTVSLYKGDVLVDQLTRKLSTLTTESTVVHYDFCLPIRDTEAADSYTVRVSASKANSVKWYGVDGADTKHAATLGGTAQDIKLSLVLGSMSKVNVVDEKIQVDGNYMLINAYAMFALKYYDEYKDFIELTYPMMKNFADYFFDETHTYERKKLNDDKSALVKEGDHKYFGEDGYGTLLLNPCCEHARAGSYWEGYDLITNVFAAEATYKMGQLASKLGEIDDCNTFVDRADKLSEDINKYMVQEFNGKKIYVEMYAISSVQPSSTPEKTFVDRRVDGKPQLWYGFSYLSMSPMAADWYKIDMDIMNNTYEAYMEHAAEVYKTASDGSQHIIRPSVCTLDENNRTTDLHGHISGKDFSWELYYLYKTGNEERLAQLMDFLAKMSVEGYYAETYNRSGNRADVGNQEQTGWLLYEIARISGIFKE